MYELDPNPSRTRTRVRFRLELGRETRAEPEPEPRQNTEKRARKVKFRKFELFAKSEFRLVYLTGLHESARNCPRAEVKNRPKSHNSDKNGHANAVPVLYPVNVEIRFSIKIDEIRFPSPRSIRVRFRARFRNEIELDSGELVSLVSVGRDSETRSGSN